MSRINFHSPLKTAEVRGWERAAAGVICGDIAFAGLGLSSYDSPEQPHIIRQVIEPDHYLHRLTGKDFVENFHLAFGIGLNDFLMIEGKRISTLPLILNSAYLLGGDVVKFLARLHGQCEIHAFIEGENRAWLAEIIERGRVNGILRADSGWESVIDLLHDTSGSPVVTSYSVCESFPNPTVAGYDTSDEVAREEFWELSKENQWLAAMNGLRSGQSGYGLELKPENWDTFVFGDGFDVFKLRQHLQTLVKKNR